MTFCKFSPSHQASNKTAVDNIFINEFLPKAPDLAVKAYLLGLAKCNNADETENNIEFFMQKLNICEEDVVSLFRYWEDAGLVQVLSTNPIEVRYLPISASSTHVKKFQVDKYADFNIQVQELFEKRMVMPNEFAEFYNLIEKYHVTSNALIRIIKFCVDMKGTTISPQYALAVAKDWERLGIHTIEQVEAKINELGIVGEDINLILSAMKSSRKAQIEDKELLDKWLNTFGFELGAIIYVAKFMQTKNRKTDFISLDKLLTKYFEMKLMDIQEIKNYESEKENLISLAVAINKELGIFYEDLTKEIDTYIVSWVNMGFEAEMLTLVADNCFKSSIRTLEGLNGILIKLFKLGIVNIDSYLQYLNDNLAIDTKIKEILLAMNLTRNVNNTDRSFYQTWTDNWKFDHSVIMYGAELSKDKTNAMQYLNKLLSNWNTAGTKTLQQVKNVKVEAENKTNFIHNNYSKEQIASFLTNLDEVDL